MTDRLRPILPLGALLVGLTLWLWPLGIGGRMPVGGDVSRFTIGLMAELGRSYRDGRLPLWNDLWGYGFPGLAESQMGFYYPVHALLYGLLDTEFAYTASLVLHTLWAGLGSYRLARTVGAGRLGAALGGFAWAASGFFVIHLPHQWGYTVGSWMPWAWALAWPLAFGTGTCRQAFLLAAVLAIQVLPGHFQLAFQTQVTVLLLGLWGLVERPRGTRRALGGCLALAAALAAVPGLTAMQLLPTYELARLAAPQRDPAYLADFTASPLHLISYLAPDLFHLSPLWRPIAWDPFHASPEEHLAYIGLVPGFLALWGLGRGWRQDATTRALGFVALVTGLLSLGPFVPGFGVLVRLPGFSFFRAPARWGLATELALALLAARAFTGLRSADPARLRRALAAFVATAIVLIGLILLTFELLLAATDPAGTRSLAPAFDQALRWLPFETHPRAAELGRRARQRPQDPLVVQALLRQGIDPAAARLDRSRATIYSRELAPTMLLLLALLVLVARRGDDRSLRAAFLVLTVLDLAALDYRQRAVESAPLRRLDELSPVLARLSREPRGTRLFNRLANLPIVAGVGSLPPYRTLDRPVLAELDPVPIDLLRRPADTVAPAVQLHETTARATGVSLRLLDPDEAASLPRLQASWPGTIEPILDSALASWIYGGGLIRRAPPALSRFALIRSPDPPTRAWLAPAALAASVAGPAASQILRTEAWLSRIQPVESRSVVPERIEAAVEARAPSTLILAVLDDPEWVGTWFQGDRAVPARLERFPGGQDARAGWIAAALPEPGRWTLRLTYRGRAAYRGLGVSAAAWSLGLIGSLWARSRRRLVRPTTFELGSFGTVPPPPCAADS